jgi:hypothetical protein
MGCRGTTERVRDRLLTIRDVGSEPQDRHRHKNDSQVGLTACRIENKEHPQSTACTRFARSIGWTC